jgi:glycosyltransferase involved in cell wall biosynthesis
MSLRILAFAYACEPGKGSEPEAGWVWARMLAGLGMTWVVTRKNNRDAIEAAVSSVPESDRLRFIYVDLPRWARVWKRGPRGALLYYMMWQVAALREVRRLGLEFHIVWHLTMSTAWLGSLAPFLGKPFIYGPVGGGVAMPWRLVRVVGLRGLAYELVRGGARTLGRYLNPLARIAWRRARLILVQNGETLTWLPPRYRSRAVIFPHIVLDQLPRAGERGPRASRNSGSQRVALYAGRLLPWKGVALALHALTLLPNWRLIICGGGPDEARLRRLTARLGLLTRVQFLGWLPRDHLLHLMWRESDVLLLPSLHDEGGWVVAEALSNGLPVVCLDRGGPPVLGGIPVPIDGVEGTIRQLAGALRSATASQPKREVPFIGGASERLRRLLKHSLGEDELKHRIGGPGRA